MNAEFFGLAFLAALNPKLLALDLLVIENRRPRAMFLWLLAGGLTVGVAIGLLDVLVIRADAIKHQASVSAGVDLGLGLLLLAAGGLAASGRVHRRSRSPDPAGNGSGSQPPDKKEGVAQRLLAEPRLALAALVGAVIGIPGAAYLTALHQLVSGKSSTTTQVVAVFVFVLIAFLLIIIPFALLELRPDATKRQLSHAQAWLLGHARQLICAVALLLGAYLTISGLVRLI